MSSEGVSGAGPLSLTTVAEVGYDEEYKYIEHVPGEPSGSMATYP